VVVGIGVLAMARVGLAGDARVRASSARLAAAQTADEQERERLMAKGKGIFVEKCAKCHNERGDKALSSGAPLNERGLGQEASAKAVSGRLGKAAAEEDRRAVTLYIASLMKGDKGTPKP
jgi:mono/diheme cytochrome c family protein